MAELFVVSRSLIEGLRLGAALRHSLVAAGLLKSFARRITAIAMLGSLCSFRLAAYLLPCLAVSYTKNDPNIVAASA